VQEYYRKVFPKTGGSILDICSSWVSHYPTEFKPLRAVGIGMNATELKENKHLTEGFRQDLNKTPQFPQLKERSFDIVTCAVSVDYLIKPLEIFKEIQRVLKPGGLAIMSFSNRCFPSKVVNMWLGGDDIQHIQIVGTYFHFTEGFEEPESISISPNPGKSDPMYIVQARKKSNGQ